MDASQPGLDFKSDELANNQRKRNDLNRGLEEIGASIIKADELSLAEQRGT